MTVIITFTDGEVITIRDVKEFKSTDTLLVLRMERGSFIYPLSTVSLFIVSLYNIVK